MFCGSMLALVQTENLFSTIYLYTMLHVSYILVKLGEKLSHLFLGLEVKCTF